jgi:hypothetical protein
MMSKRPKDYGWQLLSGFPRLFPPLCHHHRLSMYATLGDLAITLLLKAEEAL